MSQAVLRFAATVEQVCDAVAGLAGPRRLCLIADDNVMELYGAAVVRGLPGAVDCAGFPAGEHHKTRRTKARLEDRLIAHGLPRSGCLVALGGGVTLDLAGFVAATYMRGIRHVNVPTSLLAQVDAAHGGKTGVNTRAGKNLVGAFHDPVGVVVHPGFLRTLPPARWRDGLAELVKHAVVADAGLLATMEQRAEQLARSGSIEPALLERGIAVKRAIVARDARERGERAVLNFGHTVGHALERATEHRLSHGEAVAIGMVVEGHAACALTGFDRAQLERLRRLLTRLGLPVSPPPLSIDDLAPHLAVDKKGRADGVRLALPRAVGRMEPGPDGSHCVAVERSTLERALDEAGACSA